MRASQGYGDGASASESADTDDDAIFEMELEPAGPAQAVPKGHVHEDDASLSGSLDSDGAGPAARTGSGELGELGDDVVCSFESLPRSLPVSAKGIVEAFQRLEAAEVERPTPTSFDKVSVIGRGAYGKVLLVKKNCGGDVGQVFAMKVLKKANILKSKTDIRHTNAERDILSLPDIKHPFVIDLHYAFQTESMLYLVMPYVGGGDLFRVLDREGTLPEHAARFYVCELICALDHIHAVGVVYRDLKPENILLETSGHIRLTDFGLAKRLRPGEKTRTVCGTYEYMAPEIVNKTGHDVIADFWSLGALLYDMTTGGPPFTATNRYKLMEQITKAELAVPAKLSRDLVTLIGGLMNRSVLHRLGSEQKGGVAHLKRLKWFEPVDWASVEAWGLTPPFSPKTFSPADVSNFDDAFTSQQVKDTPVDPHFVLAGLDGELNPFGDFSYVPPPLAVGPPGFGDCSNPGSEPPSGYATPIAHPTSPRDSPILVNQACGGAGAGGSVSPTPIRSSSDMMARSPTAIPISGPGADSWLLHTSSLDSKHTAIRHPQQGSPPMLVPR